MAAPRETIAKASRHDRERYSAQQRAGRWRQPQYLRLPLLVTGELRTEARAQIREHLLVSRLVLGPREPDKHLLALSDRQPRKVIRCGFAHVSTEYRQSRCCELRRQSAAEELGEAFGRIFP